MLTLKIIIIIMIISIFNNFIFKILTLIGMDSKCTTASSCRRYYSTNYHYVGGFYGACNEALMKIELVNNGPLVVAFEVYNDFLSYKGGIYHHTGISDTQNFKFNPFELTNHAGLVIHNI
jgi:cathepsin C